MILWNYNIFPKSVNWTKFLANVISLSVKYCFGVSAVIRKLKNTYEMFTTPVVRLKIVLCLEVSES